MINIAKDVGGLANVLLLSFSLFVYPISNFSFFLRAINRLYLARTKDNKLFQKNKKKDQFQIDKFFEEYSDNSTNMNKKK